jgi:hypothetical protein
MLKGSRLLYLLALIKLLTPFFLQDSFYQPHRDEFLYLAEGRHLAWGYMEVPPLLSIFAWLTNLFGNGIFWIKIWPALFGAITFILVGRIILSLGGKTFALILGWLPFMLDGYMRMFFLFQPNFLEVFFWTMIAYSMIRYVQTTENKWLYILGVSVGLGMMSKYSVSFFTISLVAGLLFTMQRKIFLNKHLYFAFAIAFLIFCPNIIWQYNHRFPVITHMKELQETQLQFVNPLEFIISQFLMNLPCVYIWISGLLFLLFNPAGKPFRFIAWAWVLVITLLIILHGKDYYAMGAYPVLFAFGAVGLEKWTTVKAKGLRYAMLLFSLAFGLFAMPLVMPLAKPEALANYYRKTHLNKLLRWEDLQLHPLPQDFADMIGWKEIAQKAATVYSGLSPEEKAKTFVYCRGYGTAGALNLYGKELGLPVVHSDNASFLLWMPDKYDIKNLILVGHQIPERDDIVFQQFEKMTVRDSVDIPLFRETGMKIILFENGNDSLNRILDREVGILKDKFRR